MKGNPIVNLMGFGVARETSIWLYLCFQTWLAELERPILNGGSIPWAGASLTEYRRESELRASICLCSLTSQLPLLHMLCRYHFSYCDGLCAIQLGAKINPHLLKSLLGLLLCSER